MNVSLGVKFELYEKMVVLAVTFGGERWGMRMDERHRLDAIDIKGLRSMFGVTRMDR